MDQRTNAMELWTSDAVYFQGEDEDEIGNSTCRVSLAVPNGSLLTGERSTTKL